MEKVYENHKSNKPMFTLCLYMFDDIIDRRKKKVYTWTVDDEPAMHKMLNKNVDAIITSDPSCR